MRDGHRSQSLAAPCVTSTTFLVLVTAVMASLVHVVGVVTSRFVAGLVPRSGPRPQPDDDGVLGLGRVAETVPPTLGGVDHVAGDNGDLAVAVDNDPLAGL